MRRMVVGAVIVVAVAAGLSIAAAKGMLGCARTRESALTPAEDIASSEATAKEPVGSVKGTGSVAMERAANDQKYLFAFFWSTANDQTAAMREVFERAMREGRRSCSNRVRSGRRSGGA